MLQFIQLIKKTIITGKLEMLQSAWAIGKWDVRIVNHRIFLFQLRSSARKFLKQTDNLVEHASSSDLPIPLSLTEIRSVATLSTVFLVCDDVFVSMEEPVTPNKVSPV